MRTRRGWQRLSLCYFKQKFRLFRRIQTCRHLMVHLTLSAWNSFSDIASEWNPFPSYETCEAENLKIPSILTTLIKYVPLKGTEDEAICYSRGSSSSVSLKLKFSWACED